MDNLRLYKRLKKEGFGLLVKEHLRELLSEGKDEWWSEMGTNGVLQSEFGKLPGEVVSLSKRVMSKARVKKGLSKAYKGLKSGLRKMVRVETPVLWKGGPERHVGKRVSSGLVRVGYGSLYVSENNSILTVSDDKRRTLGTVSGGTESMLKGRQRRAPFALVFFSGYLGKIRRKQGIRRLHL